MTATIANQLKRSSPLTTRAVTATESAVPALLIEGLTKSFVVGRRRKPVVAIADVSMRLERGDIHGILGANGSGKSTLIRLISGLLTLDAGRVEVFGHDIEREEMQVKRLINRVSVDAAFFKKLSPMENLLFAARLYGLDGSTAKRDALSILHRLGISEKRVGRPVEQMSRGMQQKVAIARALLTSPTLLLLDEPTTGLDPRSKLDVQTFIEEINQTHDATIVLTTHDLAEAERLCARITVLNDGRIVAEGTADELKAQTALRLGDRLAGPATLEDVFMTYTGRSLDDDVDEDESEPDED
ncbi:MAG TPA: ABC transporter ATP-binding protein [Candidatus Limnocylindrales bacterium]|nr:ABC transporter ATP-binding protein [Candidatus Limnocylindrales bacterium]